MSEDADEDATPPRPSRLLALLLAPFSSHVISFLYLGQLRRGLGWLTAGQAIILLLFVAVVSQLQLGVEIAIVLSLCTGSAILIDLLRVAHTSRRPGIGSIVLLGIVVGLLSYGESSLLQGYVIEAFKIPSGSMLPVLQVKDRLYINKLKRVPQRGEVIVFVYPIDPTVDFIKRVIGVPGDTVQVCNSHVSINGQRLREQPLDTPCEYQDSDDSVSPGKRSTFICVAFREWNQDESYVAIYNPSSPSTQPGCSAWKVPAEKSS